MDTLDAQVTYWDRVATEKVFTLPLNVTLFQALVPLGAAILDYGCGYGRTCAELHALGYTRVMGVDISGRMIERGRVLYPDLDLRQVKGSDTWLRAGMFDACVLSAVLTCVPTDAGQEAIVAQVRRALCVGGVLCITDYPLQQDGRNQERYRRYEQKYGTFGVFELPEGAVLRHHEMSWIRHLLAAFEVLEEGELSVRTMNGNEARAFQVFARKMA